MSVSVLDQVQVLDQEIAPPLPGTQQRANLGKRDRIDLPPLWRLARTAAAIASAPAPAGAVCAGF